MSVIGSTLFRFHEATLIDLMIGVENESFGHEININSANALLRSELWLRNVLIMVFYMISKAQ